MFPPERSVASIGGKQGQCFCSAGIIATILGRDGRKSYEKLRHRKHVVQSNLTGPLFLLNSMNSHMAHKILSEICYKLFAFNK